MKRLNLKWTALIVALALGTTIVWAQQGSSSAASSTYRNVYSMMYGGGHAGYMHIAMAKLQAVITRAQESKDPAKTKAALNEAQTQHSRIERMNQCPMGGGMGMMRGSGRMHGRMMGQQRQSMLMNGMSGSGNSPIR